MSTNHHTALAEDYALTAANWNAPLSQLDQTITNMLNGSQAFSGVLIGGGTLQSGSKIGGTSTTRGHIFPSMTKAQRDAIVSPAEGLMIFNITSNTFDFYDGTAWQSIVTSALVDYWSVIATGDVTDVASETISSITQDYQDIEMRFALRSRAVADNATVFVRFDGQSTTYGNVIDENDEAAATTRTQNTQNGVAFTRVPADNQASDHFLYGTIRIYNYADVSDKRAATFDYWSNINTKYYVGRGGIAFEPSVASAIDSISFNNNGDNFDVEYMILGKARR